MTATTHALVGSMLARAIPNPYIGLPVVFVSHFILDCIPHWDLGTNWEKRSKVLTGVLSICETIIGITVAYFLFAGKVPLGYLTLAIILSELPDWAEAPWFIFFVHRTNTLSPLGKQLKKIAYWIYKFEGKFHRKAQLPWGVITQVFVLGGAYLLSTNFSFG